MQMKPVARDVCIQSCIEDCMCSVVVSKLDGTCSRKMLPLSSGRFSTTLGSVAYLKLRKPKYLLSLPNQTDDDHRERLREKSQRGLILAGSGLVATLAIVCFLFLFAVCIGFFLIYRKKKGRSTADQTATEIKVRCFSYKELEKATDGFKEELGRGSFGIVYKGKLLGSDSSIPVAVKKLDFARREPEKEFQNEVNVIGQTHHKNLVRLYGLCDDNKNRMIVYEFMNNGTLASYIFGEVKPSWKQRTEIVLGVAKGISYLHEECTSQIIYCDIKPHNILLNEYYDVKISDFGLAKLLRMDQSKTHTAIRGTKGYLAPEWFRNMPVSTKVDVYSFGVVLLEVICCRKSVEDENYDEEKRILTDWAYDCFKEKAFEALIDWEAEALEDREKLERFTKVSMWCIQESASMRPTMRQVVQMLEGVVEVLVPPCPCPYALSITY